MWEIKHTNENGSNKTRIIQHAHKLYLERTRKQSESEHWSKTLKDQSKRKKFCDPPQSKSSKMSNAKRTGDKWVSGSD